MSEQIDWSKAPEGTIGHGNIGISNFHVRFSDKWYEYVNSNHGGRHYFGDTCTYKKNDIVSVTYRQTSPSWSGEGLPPVGVRCEAAIPHTGGPGNERSFIWIEGSVIAYYEIKGKTYAWFSEDDGFYPPAVLEFRTIRTPEQIAADERKSVIDVACYDIEKQIDKYNTTLSQSIAIKATIEAMIDAGYRKQEKPE